MQPYRTKTVAAVGLFSALSMILSAVESALPALPIPGARLGLANIAVTAATVLVSPWCGGCAAAIKVLFALFTRGVTACWMALCGTALSFLMMLCLLPLVRRERLTYVGVSAASATAHTLGQLAAASCMLSAVVWSYAPLLLVCGVIAGCVTGLVLNLLIVRLMPLKNKGE